MKKVQRARHDFDFLKKQLPKYKKQAAETRTGNLWHMESVVRNKAKAMRALGPKGLGGEYKPYAEEYNALLRMVSERILEHYNRTRKTDYQFDDVVRGNYGGFLESGIMSVLVTSHIPKMAASEFRRLLPKNPKDEYPQARKLKRKFFLHLGETNTGKTYNALQRLKQSHAGIYLAPLRILALENYERLNNDGVLCNLLTGEEEILVDGAMHTSCTVEKANIQKSYDIAVIDEIQMIADSQRGDAWTRAMLGLCCEEIHLCGALNAKEQLIRMISDCGDEYETIIYTRQVPLKTLKKPIEPGDVEPGDALITFSKRGVLSLSKYLSDIGIKSSVIYGDLPPEVRRLQYDAFLSGKNQILISTDAIGMGVNLPIQRIIFTQLEKFDGEQFRSLTSQEVKQIAGRAGRLGIYDIGYVASATEETGFIAEQLKIPDIEIAEATVGPSEVLLNIGLLPLKEKLALWGSRDEPLDYYRKKDVRDLLIILDKIQPFHLPELLQWRLMQLPFDVNSEEILEQFVFYVEQLSKKAPTLIKPVQLFHTLSAFEVFYQKINLYYSFSKNLNFDFDEDWVYETRKRVCENINELLISL